MKEVLVTADSENYIFFQFTLENIVNYEKWLSKPPGKHLANISSFFDWHE